MWHLGFAILMVAAQSVETRDRMSPQQMAQMVASPMERVAAGDLEAGERQFQNVLRRALGANGEPTLQSADLHTAFGVELYMAAVDENDKLAAASLQHLRRAVEDYRTVFGSNHPEVALGLTSLADAMGELSDGGRANERIPLVREALEIRKATLGVRNPETVSTMANLAGVLIEVEAATDEDKREALSLFDTAKSFAPPDLAAGDDISAPMLDLGRARVLAAMGRTNEAVQLARQAVNQSGRSFAICVRVMRQLDLLERHLDPTDTQAVNELKQVGNDCPLTPLVDLLNGVRN